MSYVSDLAKLCDYEKNTIQFVKFCQFAEILVFSFHNTGMSYLPVTI